MRRTGDEVGQRFRLTFDERGVTSTNRSASACLMSGGATSRLRATWTTTWPRKEIKSHWPIVGAEQRQVLHWSWTFGIGKTNLSA